MMDSFDYIVIGAGSAGAALAARLAESGTKRVALLEAGPRRTAWWTKVPIAYVFFFERSTPHGWGLTTLEEPYCDGRVFNAPRGRGLGGTSLINSMMYVRGLPTDYDGWATMGNTGWSYEDVLPFFKKAERHAWGASDYHGGSGPLEVRPHQSKGPLHTALVDAGVELGFPVAEDFNGARYEGFGRYHHNQFVVSGRRCSTGAAYLNAPPGNLDIRTDALVVGLRIKRNRVTGVEYELPDKTRRTIGCRHEVIVSAGAFKSPQLLMLSGIGPGAALREHGIEVRVDAPGVGENLHDHYGADIVVTATRPVTLYSSMRPWGAAKALWQWATAGQGAFSFFPFDSGAMIRSDDSLTRPNLQFLFGDYMREGGAKLMHRHGYNLAWCQMVPRSRGTVRLKSADPHDAPAIRHNFLAHEEDREVQRKAFRLARRILAADAFAEFRGEEIVPGTPCASDEEIDGYIARNGGQHHHPVGTVRMGTDPDAPLDPRLRVRGVDGLRVADASIMPQIVSGNTNAPCIMIGERAAHLILSERT